MSTYSLIPGAGGAAWYWHRIVPQLTAAGHTAIAVDLPGDDEQAGLPRYAARSRHGPRRPVAITAGADDRFFPAEFQRRVARDRLGLEADVLPGGHLIALARPEPLADYLLAG
jgi:pimeloyl-ACP methyl ester carboxylesterase